MDFYYKKIPIIDPRTSRIADYIYRPIIKIGIKVQPNGKSDFVYYDALVDSGADECIFPADLAEVVGIDLKGAEKRTFTGLGGGSVAGYERTIKMNIGGHEFSTEVYFVPNLRGYGILGQRGFFEKFRVRFIYSKKKIEVISDLDR